VIGVLEYLWFRDNDPWWATLLRAVTLIALAVLSVNKGMQKVPSGSRALRTRFGKVVHYRRDIYDRSGFTVHHHSEAKVIGPGLVISIPFVHDVMIESVTEQFEKLKPITRLYPVRKLTCQITFKVVDLEKALIGVDDYKGLLVNRCAAEVLRLSMDTNLGDGDISTHLLADESPLQQRARQMGVELLEFNVSRSELIEPAQLLNGPFGLPPEACGRPSARGLIHSWVAFLRSSTKPSSHVSARALPAWTWEGGDSRHLECGSMPKDLLAHRNDHVRDQRR
jgi:hypothetical protein